MTDSIDTRTQTRPLLGALLSLALIVVIVWQTIEWTVNRIYVEPGNSLLLRYKGPPLPIPGLGVRPPAAPGQFAKVDENGRPLELGVLEQMRGPGRHFYCPLWWERTIVPDVIVKPGQVGVVRSKMGKDLPPGQFLVEGDLGATEFKGTLRRAFGPGRYRVNPYAYDFQIVETKTARTRTDVKHSGWVEIPTGYVGVVTSLADNPQTGARSGIQDEVLPPGLYLLNPSEKVVDIVEIGYRETTIAANLKRDRAGNVVFDDSGEPIIADDDSGIGFPSNDGFPIRMDFTAIWGVMPDQAPEVIRKFGNVDAIEQKVVIPQIESICRNEGSKLGAVELLVGESRQQFQLRTSETFRRMLKDKGITVLNGLVRHIHIPQEVRTPIQEAKIAEELRLTRQQEQKTAATEGELRRAEEEVLLATARVEAETRKMVEERKAEGARQAAEIRAETERLVAAIDKQVAELEAKATVLLGEAQAKARQLQEEARSELFQLAVDAFGAPEAYNQWVFARGLPEDIRLDLIYAGEGTFWTDLKTFTEALLARQATGAVGSGATPRRPETPPRTQARSPSAQRRSSQPELPARDAPADPSGTSRPRSSFRIRGDGGISGTRRSAVPAGGSERPGTQSRPGSRF